MAQGPGKYDDFATKLRRDTEAAAVIVAVIGGTLGNGFSVQGFAEHLVNLPGMLRSMADQIEKDMAGTLTISGTD